MSNQSTRRDAIKKFAAATVALTAGNAVSGGTIERIMEEDQYKLKRNINHSVCKWTHDFLSLEELCVEVKKMGFSAIDLLTPSEWPIAKKHGIHVSMCYTNGKVSLTEGWNNKKNHAQLIAAYTEAIPLVAEAGYQNLICFSGNRNGMDDETGLQNCVEGLKQIMPLAEKHNVIIQIEVFNSKVDHKDYMADNTKWTIELCKRLGSPNFKILYDIYHMQISEGDIIHTIKQNHQYFGHYHTAGVPGRHEIIENQELFYPAIMKAIVETGYKGYVAQEYIPTGKTKEDKLAALKDAIKRCDV
ncbi:hydroxypyruvate isomerase [Lacibacter cauensis]|uniref:Hydroxypyruvate isomerase n=1 Tax=Lacibacter cauensis TaxID=510947 RepID=A0A562SPM3_9BACT|nr:TIM barrel protein [Lacibacter cauensis]TWI83158.1 hydroxypyruvate isomerase [Lacibacter cauensis]